MGTLYLIDAHNSTLANSEINDTIPLELGDTQLVNGSFVVSVPFGIPVDGTPTSLTELITKKYAGLLAYYPGFVYIDYDDCMDATGWDAAAAGTGGFFLGERGSISLSDAGVLESNVVALAATPSEVVITWEVFDLVKANPKEGILTRSYQEMSATDFTAEVTFNGTDWNTVTDGVLFSIPLAEQGSNFEIRFTNASGSRRWLGSWAVLY